MNEFAALLPLLLVGWCTLAFVWLIFFQSPKLALMESRLEMFMLRDELFALGCSGEVPFDSDAHRCARGLLNGSIRYAYDLTFVRLLILRASGQNKTPFAKAVEKHWEGALEALPTASRHKVNAIVGHMHYWLVLQMVKRSLVLQAFVCTSVAALLMKKILHATAKRAKKAASLFMHQMSPAGMRERLQYLFFSFIHSTDGNRISHSDYREIAIITVESFRATCHRLLERVIKKLQVARGRAIIREVELEAAREIC